MDQATGQGASSSSSLTDTADSEPGDDAVTDESATGGVIAEATAQPVDSPTADAVLDDLPPVLPEAEDVPADAETDE